MGPVTLTAGPYRLHAFGQVDLTGADATSVDSVLRRPKRMALLVYLAVSPGAYCRRDTVLGIFWPEFDQKRARAALRKGVHFLRLELGHGVITSRGYEEIGVDAEQILCDADDFETAFQNDDYETALKAYRGDFLDAFHVSDVPEFDRWAAAARLQMRKQAVSAADRLTQRALTKHDASAAIRWAQEWVRLAPTDEVGARALMSLFEHSGEPAKALETYGELAIQLGDLDLAPSPETQSIERRLRLDGAGARGPASHDLVAAHVPIPETFPPPPPVATGATGASEQTGATSSEPAFREETSARLSVARLSRVKAAGGVLILVSLAAMSVFIAGRWGDQNAGVDPNRPKVAVLPFANRTGDEGLDELGRLVAEELTSGLAEVRLWIEVEFRAGALQVVRVAEMQRVLEKHRGRPPTRFDPEVAADIDVDYVVTGSYSLRNDSLHFRSAVVGVVEERSAPPPERASGPASNPSAVIAELRNHVMGAVAHAATAGPWFDMTPESPTYEAWVEAIQALGRGQFAESEASHRRAIALAPDFSRVYWTLGHGSLFNQRRWPSIDSLAETMSRGVARMNVAHRAIRDGFTAMARGNALQFSRASDHLAEVVPYGPSWFMQGLSALAANYPRAAAEAQLVVLDSAPGFAQLWWSTWDVLTDGLHLLGDHQRELEISQRAATELRGQSALPFLIKSFAGLGEVREAERLMEEALNAGWLNPYVDGAAELRVHGHREASDSMLVQLVDVLGQRDRVASPLILADALVMLGRLREARTILEDMLPDDRNTDIVGRLGLISATAGYQIGAESMASELASLSDPYLFGSNTIWRAKIAAAMGDKVRAVDLLRTAFSEGFTIPAPERARQVFHRDPAFEPLWDYGPYQEFMRPKG